MIRVTCVSKKYGSESEPILALDKVDLTIESGVFAALVGPSGCGKSTLLHLLAGADTPTSGEVWVNGQALTQLSDAALSRFRRDRVGLVYQFYNLLPTLSAWENVALPTLLAGVAPREARARAEEWLASVGLAHRKDHWPHELSGGEMQRVAIARALVNGPRLLLADEPTGNLDSATGRAIMELLQRINREQAVTLLMATHSQEAAAFASRVIRMKDGQIVPEDRR
ncbi:MAG TPA: ABC transporter ATP-binding protein [Candidatus Baltobacteraceae bacterium]|nr:ABC transporter ATP-binding protein [Candidatus Baltobacteraceae bacterium]